MAIPGNQEVVQFTNMQCSDDGTLHIGCFNGNVAGSGHVVYTNSTDGGQTWAAITQIAPLVSKGPDPYADKEVHSRENAATSLAVDGDNVYMAWTHQENKEQQGFYAYSNDGGTNWSQPVEFGLEVSTDSFFHFFANIAASNDRATISWYEVDKSTLISNYKMVEITDAGATLGIPVTVSTQSTNFTGAGSNQFKFYGDYNSSVKDGCITYSTWADGTITPTVYVTKFDGCAPVSVFEVTPVNSSIVVSNMYPNPAAKDVLHVDIQAKESTANVHFGLYSIGGKLVRNLTTTDVTKGNSVVQLNVSDISHGTYVLRLTLPDGVFITRKVILL